jgi:hypothetical protein
MPSGCYDDDGRQRPPRGQDGHRWYVGLRHCPRCHALLQTDGYGDDFCLVCGWYDTDFAAKGLELYRALEHDMLSDPEAWVHVDLEGGRR